MDQGDSVRSDAKPLQQTLEENLRPWKCVLTHGYSVLVWNKPHYPIVLSGLLSLLFGIIWLTDVSVITTFSLLGIFICILDYLVPIISEKYLEPHYWKDDYDSDYQMAVHKIVASLEKIQGISSLIRNTRTLQPKMYYLMLFLTLLTTAWIGNLINNLLLTYMFFLGIVLYPGLYAHGHIQKAQKEMCLVLGKVFPSKTKTK